MVQSRTVYFFAGLAYVAFVIYGSLVPFDFHPRSLDAALKDFNHIRYLQLGMDSRADWVANILLYIPLSYLWLGCARRDGQLFQKSIISFVVFSFCVALSLAIEFVQLFFPPRTVSLNDIIAEILGSAIGIVLWWTGGRRLRRLFAALLSEDRSAAHAGLILYTIAYLGFSLFPYDFLISAEEIRNKLAGAYFQVLPSSATCGGSLRCGAKLVVEAAAVVPLGLLFGLLSRKRGLRLFTASASIGFWLGLAIEALQFFLVSGLTLGASVLTRMIGVIAGAALGEMFAGRSLWPLLYLLGPLMPVTIPIYTVLLAAVTWSGKGPLLSVDQGIIRLQEISFMPFYYHYYTSESAAMASLLGTTAMFLPIGAQYWVWRVMTIREFAARGALQAGLLSTVIAAGLESGKLFLRGARPDPTNVIIAAVAAAVGFIVVSICANPRFSFTAPADDIAANESS